MKKSNFRYNIQRVDLLYENNHIGNGVSADINRDGKLDLIYSVDISGANKPIASPVGIFVYTDQGYKPYKLTIDGKSNHWPDVKFGMYTVVEDINYDGIPDIIPIDQTEVEGTKGYFEGNYQYAYISLGIGNYKKIQIGNDKYNVHGWGTIKSNDGKFRIVFNTPWTENYIFGISTVISTYNQDTNSFESKYISATDPYYAHLNQERHKEYFYQSSIDINNDGNTDIVGFTSFQYGINSIYLNDGKGNFNFYKNFDTGLTANQRVEEISIGDFNGDRFDDMIIMGVDHATPTYKKTLKVLVNDNGKNFVDKTNQYLGSQFQNIESSWGFLDSFDVNNDNLTDITWNHWSDNNHTGINKFEVMISNSKNFEINTIENLVGSRTISLGNNILYDGHNLFSLYDEKKIDVDKVTCKLPLERQFIQNSPIVETYDINTINLTGLLNTNDNQWIV